MKKVRILALLLALVLCFSACANQPAAGGEATQAPTNAPAGNDPTDAPTEGPKMYWDMLDEVTESSELPDWTGKTLEIKLWSAAGTNVAIGTDPTGTAVWDEVYRITGVKLNWNESFNNGGNNISAKMPQVIASGDLPTVMEGYDIGGEMKELFANGYLLDFTPYLENGMLSHYQEALGFGDLDAEIWSSVRTADGKYFALPSTTSEAFLQQKGMTNCGYDPEAMAKTMNVIYSLSNEGWSQQFYIRDDVLKAIRPDAKTWKDLQAIYEANGNVFYEEDIYDMGFSGMDAFMDFLREIKAVVSDFTALDGSTCEVVAGPASDVDNWEWMNYWPHLIDGRTNSDPFLYAVLDPESPEEIYAYSFEDGYMKDFAAKLNTLVREDIISQNSLVDNSQTRTEKRLNGHYVVLHTYAGGDIKDLNAATDEWDYRPMVIHGEFGALNTVYTCPVSTIVTSAIFQDAVPEDQMEQLIRCIDFLSSKVGVNLQYFGPSSLGLYEIREDGKWYFTDQYCIDALFNGGEYTKIEEEYGLTCTGRVQSLGIGAPGIHKFVLHPVQRRDEVKVEDTETCYKVFCAGVVDKNNRDKGQSVVLLKNEALYGGGQDVEGFASFWTQRPAFEAQMKKAIAAATPEAFEAEWEALKQLCIEAGLTEEALIEYNTKIIYEPNKDYFEAAGMFQ